MMIRALPVILLLPCVAIAGAPTGLSAGGRPIEPAELAAKVRAARVVYVGEEHGKPEHHKLQRDILKILVDAGPAALGCEYFPRSLQPALDRFNSGEVALDDFPALVDWEKTWGHPWEAYRPLFELCQQRRIPVIALNAERTLVRRVSKQGLESFSVPELLALPRMLLGNERHRTRVERSLQEAHPMSPEMLNRFYQAHSLWDATMAESVVDLFLRDRRPALRVLVVAGRGHIEEGTGIPDHVSARFPAPRLVVVCDSSGKASPEIADVIFAAGPRLY